MSEVYVRDACVVVPPSTPAVCSKGNCPMPCLLCMRASVAAGYWALCVQVGLCVYVCPCVCVCPTSACVCVCPTSACVWCGAAYMCICSLYRLVLRGLSGSLSVQDFKINWISCGFLDFSLDFSFLAKGNEGIEYWSCLSSSSYPLKCHHSSVTCLMLV